jgi:hypothetical protein
VTPARAEAEPSHAEIIARVGRQVTTCFDGLARAMVAGQNELRRDIRNLQKSVVLLERTVDERERASDKASAIVRKSLESRIEGAVGGAHDEIRHETGALHGRIDKLESRLTRPATKAARTADQPGGDGLDALDLSARSLWQAVLKPFIVRSIWARAAALATALLLPVLGGLGICTAMTSAAGDEPVQAAVVIALPDRAPLVLRPAPDA